MQQPPTVLLVDDIPLFRQAIRDAVESWGARVVAEAANGREALSRYAEYRPDLVFLDIMMPEMDGIEALRWLRRYDPDARVIMCSSIKDSQMIYAAIRLGALDFVPKPFTGARIAEALSLAAGGVA
ncbi:response regulator [Spirochaeta africana]|uniref:Response regulator containing CheY-like receiver domain and AraC-type DNA-binding domain n=1 Tax=Spirochaeta africana (strain ATCC 700263 / DSM 8902 / Z-7692) TaxID=889378 RepID=H9UI00_SPIAZ|nr:response regulator [Spirochaeta africana]AFG37143.1 response regulator containing CheY-like receiver domain and AraC-type DNA-binding domain [Spirochaeta africana DSM 8902]